MSILQQLRGLSSAEEFFAFLDVDFDPKVVNVARLHILRRMGEYLAREDLEALDEKEARGLCRAQLEKAYVDFVASSPLEQRVFKVLKDAVKPKPAASPRLLVPLAALTASTNRRSA
jgi:nitrogenase-stabilizing/protective protein